MALYDQMANSLTKIFLRLAVVFIILFTLMNSNDLQAQDDLHIVQVSGLVMDSDSSNSIFGVHIYDPYTGRGTVSDYRGWFSKAFLAGDTVIFSAVGYKTATIVIPDDEGTRYNIVLAMEDAVTELADVEVNPFPTEELFKEAILAMNLSEDQENVLRNFSAESVSEMVRTMPIEGSPSMNYRYMMNQQFYNLQNAAGPRANPLLNPFAWAQFINSLKKKKK